MKKVIVVTNILIQLLWYVVAGVITYFVVRIWFNGINQPWRSVIGCLTFVVIVALISIITNIIKAMKDPDVQAASNLEIPIYRYRKYKEWYDEHQRLMQQYGVDSKEANAYFALFFKQIKYPNEWRKYQQSRYKSISSILNNMEDLK